MCLYSWVPCDHLREGMVDGAQRDKNLKDPNRIDMLGLERCCNNNNNIKATTKYVVPLLII